ncbi:MAG: NAD(P)H-dependent oxidoreductase subunit E [Elusimicrobiota bacterium]|jgi:NADH-quinone oxidoreductase subunit E|nr:NAD(P)H-dependent oxidoreductase subunit E [Elusimicrobiota bacterium]
MSNSSNEELNSIVDKWKDVKGSLVMMLHAVQDKFGYVPRSAAMEISSRAKIPLAKIYEVLTFYHFFKLTAPAKHQIAVCTGTACYLKGSQELIKALETELGVSAGQTTADGRFSVTALRCLGCCVLAPVMTVNGKIHGHVKPADIPSILREISKGEEQNAQ